MLDLTSRSPQIDLCKPPKWSLGGEGDRQVENGLASTRVPIEWDPNQPFAR